MQLFGRVLGQPRPLLVLILIEMCLLQQISLSFAYQSYGSTLSATTTTTTTTTTTGSNSGSGVAGLIRLRANKLRRPESCREQLPSRSQDLPELVITGRVKQVYLAGGDSAPGAAGVASQNESNRALVTIGRVIKGSQQLLGSNIIVSGFNASTASSTQACPNYIKPNDTLILLLIPDSGAERRYSIQGNNLLALNLQNLDRINAIATDEAYKRRAPIEDILCEAHYCPYGRCVVLGESTSTQSSYSSVTSQQLTCKCPDSCPPLPTPVCGSDNVTYTNECHLIKEGCRLRRPLFVTKETSC